MPKDSQLPTLANAFQHLSGAIPGPVWLVRLHGSSRLLAVWTLLACLTGSAAAQTELPESLMNRGRPPRSLFPFTDLFADSKAKLSTPQRLRLPLTHVKPASAQEDAFERMKSNGRLPANASKVASHESPFDSSTAQPYLIEDVIAEQLPSDSISISGSDAPNDVKDLTDTKRSAVGKPRAVKHEPTPAKLALSSNEAATEEATLEESRASAEPLPVPASPEPLPLSESEALSSLVRFAPKKTPAALATAQVRAAVVKKVPATYTINDDEEMLRVPVPPPGNSELEGAGPRVAFEEIPTEFKAIGSLGVKIRAREELLPENVARKQVTFPRDIAAERFQNAGEVYHSPGFRREWAASSYAWVAPGLCHYPLYFEDINLERHGHSFGLLQPAVSIGNFYARLALLPYQMAITPPFECVYTLGYNRPGTYVPFYLHRPQLRARGALAEAATIAALFLIFP